MKMDSSKFPYFPWFHWAHLSTSGVIFIVTVCCYPFVYLNIPLMAHSGEGINLSSHSFLRLLLCSHKKDSLKKCTHILRYFFKCNNLLWKYTFLEMCFCNHKQSTAPCFIWIGCPICVWLIPHTTYTPTHLHTPARKEQPWRQTAAVNDCFSCSHVTINHHKNTIRINLW